MSSIKRPSKPSGEHEAVLAFRSKALSITETTMPLLVALEERIDRARSAPPKSLEGEWGVIVRGVGALPPDAHHIAAVLVQELRVRGAVILQSTLTSGANISEVEPARVTEPPPESEPEP